MDETTMETTAAEEYDFDAFMEEDGGDSGNQTTETKETDVDETNSEGDSGAETEEKESDDETQGSEESGAGEEPGADGAEETFTLKVNKQEQTVTREEMVSLAQKGLDYDRVKDQQQRSQQTIQTLQAQLEESAKHQDTLDILQLVAEKSGMTMEQIAETMYVNYRKSAGASEDAARQELKTAKLQKELNAVKAQAAKPQKEEHQETGQEKFQKEMEEFRREYPDVKMTDEIVDKLVPDVQAGMSITAAYRKMERTEKDARIAELERKLAAKEQNNKNKRTSPGSQNDSGGQRKRDAFDDFMEGFN